MKFWLSTFSFLALSLLLALPANAQIKTPAASPSSELTQMVGLTEVKIAYSRPSMKGRTIYAADGLVPYGKLWRTGANSATKMSFSDAVKVGGEKLDGGDYAVLAKPGADMWMVNFYPYEGGRWSSYVEQKPVAAISVKPSRLNDAVETFTIGVSDLKMDAANINLDWANTRVSIPLSVEVDGVVMKNIESVMAGPSAGDYYTAGVYYHDTGKDLKKAYEWVRTANKMRPRFWMLRRQSLIEADLGMKKEAIVTAKRSLEMATEAGNDDYIKMNKDSIKEWSM